MKIKNVKEKHLLLAKELIELIESNREDKTITYGELSARINRKIIPVAMGKPLGVLSTICYDNNMPLITVLVYSKKNNRKIPSDGFFNLFFPEIEGNTDREYETYLKELDKVIKYKYWNRLIDILERNVQP